MLQASGARTGTDFGRTKSAPTMNATLSIDEQVVARARQVAAVRGTSLNQLIWGGPRRSGGACAPVVAEERRTVAGAGRVRAFE